MYWYHVLVSCILTRSNMACADALREALGSAVYTCVHVCMYVLVCTCICACACRSICVYSLMCVLGLATFTYAELHGVYEICLCMLSYTCTHTMCVHVCACLKLLALSQHMI